MADKTEEAPPKKRRFYHNLKDAYTMVQRTYSWLGWALLAIVAVCVISSVALGIVLDHWISYPFMGVMLAMLLSLILLTTLLNPALYAQIDGKPGAVGAVLSRQSKGWIVSDQPAVVTRQQDLVWRAIGRPGVILISEGPASRAKKLLDEERRRVHRLIPTVPIHMIQYGHEDGQIPLPKVAKVMRSYKKALTKTEVPAVDRRLTALGGPVAPVPKGVDPQRMRPSKRAMYGRK